AVPQGEPTLPTHRDYEYAFGGLFRSFESSVAANGCRLPQLDRRQVVLSASQAHVDRWIRVTIVQDLQAVNRTGRQIVESNDPRLVCTPRQPLTVWSWHTRSFTADHAVQRDQHPRGGPAVGQQQP